MGRNPQRECINWPIVPDKRADWELKPDTLKMWLGLLQGVLLLWEYNEDWKAMQDPRFEVLTVVKCPGVWCCVVGVIADISKDHGAFIFKDKQFKNKLFLLGLLFPADWRHYNPLQCQEPHTQWHGVSSFSSHLSPHPCNRILKVSLKLLSSCIVSFPDSRNIARHADTLQWSCCVVGTELTFLPS